MTNRINDTVIDSGGVLIVGAGLAGLFGALKLNRPVTVLSAAPLGAGASSVWAQGGIAAALGADDSPDLHVADTLAAGAGIVDPNIAEIIAREAEARIEDLSALGVPFDRDTNGAYVLGREAAHSRHRIVRVSGDRAGAEIMKALVAAVRQTPRIRIAEGLVAFQLALEDGRVVGVYAHPVTDRAQTVFVRAEATIFALGGVGGLYEVTTNPAQARGQGVGMAARAGAMIADPEFVQFHPTAINIERDPAPLATEALRGEGAVLVNELGQRFMLQVHEDAELAPRDIVARGIFREIQAGRKTFLDARAAVGDEFPKAFPTVFASCMSAGIDPRTQLIPVAPAAHYHMGGISVDEHARTSLPGLWAIGECASTGAHGANRLASNSLLEAVVFGARAAADVSPLAMHARTLTAIAPHGRPAPLSRDAVATLRHTMTMNVGLERNASGLRQALDTIARLERAGGNDADLRNMTATATLIAAAALQREESRGGHFRSDFPAASEAWRHRTFLTLDEAQAIGANQTAGAIQAAQ
ncbi:MAG: L-aspartate oxidase [Alphaproteobacteria bacterium]|nr:L-aspartate oxidase [Alphaproteobacteria bacterium]